MKSTNHAIINGTKYRNVPAVLVTPEDVTQEVSAPMCSKSIPNSTTESIPYGYCHCGCGEKTTLARKTDSRKGWKRGEPVRYVRGHQRRVKFVPDKKTDESTVLIPVYSSVAPGLFATIDLDDYDLVRQYRWAALPLPNGRGVYALSTGGGRVLMHRLILGLDPGDSHVDHVDRDTLNNRRANLRLCNHTTNLANSVRNTDSDMSKYRGVWWSNANERWCARISVNRKRKHLGYFSSQEEAALAYDEAARAAFGEFARLNFPRKGERQA